MFDIVYNQLQTCSFFRSKIDDHNFVGEALTGLLVAGGKILPCENFVTARWKNKYSYVCY